MRAPTPTAAAEMAVPVRLELMAWVDQQGARLSQSLSTGLTQRGQRLRDVSRGLPSKDSLLDGPRQRLDTVADKLPMALRHAISTKQLALSRASGPLRPSILQARLARSRDKLSGAARGLRADVISRDIARKKERLQAAGARLIGRAQSDQAARAAKLASLVRLSETLGHHETLKRGYAIVRSDGALVMTTADARAAKSIEIEFADGRVTLDT